MKRSLVLASALLLALVPMFAGPVAADPAGRPNRTVVVRHGGHGSVVVRHNGRGSVTVRRTGNMVWRRPPVRPGQFFHRGSWFARVHAPAFRYPHGWRYRAWAVGAILPALFLAPDYYYDDYAALNLQAPAPGYRWVRYGPDLLLVNIRTGEVEDVVNDAFD